MTIYQFITTLKPFADEIQQKYGIPIEVSLGQAALESAWGKKAPGNMYFGVKAGKDWTGKKQLITTTEYHSTDNVRYPEIISVIKLTDGKYKYKVKDWFRAYDSPAGSFNDYAKILKKDRYKKAFDYINDPYKFIQEVAKAGYATAPTYYEYMVRMINTIKRGLKKNPGHT